MTRGVLRNPVLPIYLWESGTAHRSELEIMRIAKQKRGPVQDVDLFWQTAIPGLRLIPQSCKKDKAHTCNPQNGLLKTDSGLLYMSVSLAGV